MNRMELIENFALKGLLVSETLVNSWIKKGVPYKKTKRYDFNFKEVIGWLKYMNCDIENPYYNTLMTTRELSEELGINQSTIRNYCKTKGMPFQNFLNGTMAYDLEEATKWLKRYRSEANG